jgi:hypothetical protein
MKLEPSDALHKVQVLVRCVPYQASTDFIKGSLRAPINSKVFHPTWYAVRGSIRSVR